MDMQLMEEQTATEVARGPSLWRRLGTAVVVAFLVAFVVGNRSELPAAWHALRDADRAWLVVALGVMVLWLVNLGVLHAATQRAAGLHPRAARAVPLATAANFLNLVTKSGGMAGLSVFAAEGRRRGQPRGPVVAAYLLAAVLGEVGFAVALVAALVVVWVDGRLTTTEIVAGLVFTVYLAVRMGLLGAAVRSRGATRRLHAAPGRLVARLRRRPAAEPDHAAADELFDAVQLLRARPLASVPAMVSALVVEVLGVAMLWAVLEAFGAREHLSVPFVAYAISVLFAIVGFLPGGIGFVEVSLGAALVSFGVAGPTAAAVVLVYRLLEMWLPVALGAACRAALHLQGSSVTRPVQA